MKLSAIVRVSVVVLTALPAFSAAAPLMAEDLLLPAAASGELLGTSDLGVLRSRPVLWNAQAVPGANQSGALPFPGHKLRLNLFDDVAFTAVMERTEVLPRGFSWVGYLEGEAVSSVVIVVYEGVMSASITSPAAAYALRYAGGGIHLVQEIDRNAYPPDESAFVPTRPYDPLPATDETTASDDGSAIDVMVVYTPAAKTAAGGESGILSRINLGVAETNVAFATSGVIPRLRLVHAAEVAYTESGILQTDLDLLTNTSDGVIDDVHTLRDTYGADMVQMVVHDASLADCGIAWPMDEPSAGFKTNAFSVTEQACISPNYTFGHELGHNMGLNHARDDDGCPSGHCGSGAYSYAFGYKEPSGLFRTVMAYECATGPCPRVLRFSNPSLTYDGIATGVSATASNSASNAQALNETRLTVANWRTAIPATTVFATYDGGVYDNTGVTRIDVLTGQRTDFPGYDFYHPHGLAIGPDGKLYVAFIGYKYYRSTEFIMRMNLDGSQRENVASRDDWRPRGLAFSGTDLYLTTEWHDSGYISGVWKIPGVAAIPYGGQKPQPAFLWPMADPDGTNHLFGEIVEGIVFTSQKDMLVADNSLIQVLRSAPPYNRVSVLIDRDNPDLYRPTGLVVRNGELLVSDGTMNDIRRFDLASGHYLGTLASFEGDPRYFDTDHLGNLYVAVANEPYFTGGLWRVDSSGTKTQVVSCACGMYGVAVVPPTPTVSFSTPLVTVSETATSVMLTVGRAGATTAALTVPYSTADGTANAGLDYTETSGTLTFAPGVTSKTIKVTLKPDTLVDPGESFGLNLGTPVGGILGTNPTATVIITDDDKGGQLEFSAAALSVNEPLTVPGSAPFKAVITVTRTGGSASGVTVHYSTADGTAVSSGETPDYNPASGTLTFAAGVVSKKFNVEILPDDASEGYETINLSLDSPTGGAEPGANSNATLTVVDSEPVVQFAATTHTVGEAAPKATLTLKRTGSLAGTLTVNIGVIGGTAQGGSDYANPPATVTLPVNAATKTFTIDILDDLVVEPSETVELGLSNCVGGSAGCTSGPQANTVLTITDDEPRVAFGAAIYTVSEAKPSVTITLRRTGSLTAAIPVSLSATGGTAIGGVDYGPVPATVTIPAKAATKSFTIPIINDTIGEQNETIELTITDAPGGAIGAPGSTIVTITDNEPTIALSAGSYVAAEPTAATPNVLTIAIKRTGTLTQASTVDYAITAGTATQDVDYRMNPVGTPYSGKVTFAAGATSKSLKISILPDLADEPDETIRVALSNVTGAKLGTPDTALATILDDD